MDHCSIFGPPTSWDAHCKGTQFGNSLLSTPEREFLSSIFEDQDDYQIFIEVLKDAIELWDIRISAYCLMPNHYHLLIHTPKGNLSRSMRHINGVSTQRFNRLHGFDGQLFRGHYKSIVVDGDSYLMQLVRYIDKQMLLLLPS